MPGVLDINALHQNYQPFNIAPTVPQKKQGRGGFLSSLISEAGGAGGAVGGAAIGTALLPGIGTVLGAGLGGFLGGTGGRVVENEVRDSRVGLGDALKEGALAGILSGAGETLSLAKAGKALTGEKGLANIGKNIAAGADARAAGAVTGAIEGTGKGLKAGGMGVAQGATAPGIEGIGAQKSDELLKTIQSSFGIKPGSPEAVQRALEPKLANLGEKIGASYAKANVALTQEELNRLGTNVIQKVTTQGGLDKGAENFALEQARRLVKSGDVEGLWNFTKDLEKNSINFARGSSAANPAKESVARIIREEARSFLDAKVPGLAEQNAVYHQGLDANKLLIKASKNQTGGGLVGKISTLSPVKSAESKLGGAVEKIGQYSAGTGGTGTKLAQQAKFQLPANLAGALSGQGPQTQDLQLTGGNPLTDGLDQTGASEQGGQQQAPAESQYPLDRYLADVQRDPKNASQYASIFKTVQDAEGSGSSGNVGKVSAQQYQLSQQGVNALGKFAQLIQSDPGVVQRSATPGRGLPGIGGYISKASGTNQYDTLGFAAVSSLLRAQSGAAVPDSEVRSYMRAYLPRAGDSQEDIQQKLQTLQYAFQTVLQGGGGQSSGLQSALGQ